ncbi:MAG TPA: hypothetical protein DD473_02735 [Planctomycetaceae bacterium]|nr:hypothetical protein [Planctomycetaceae bacterium]|tara:strand:- start:1119 stop:1766 length:648 start_codon:yes stop_codon:yes gene_type:complete
MSVQIVYGSNQINYDLEGVSVNEAKEILKEVLNLPSVIDAYVNCKRVGEDYVLAADDRLEFLKEGGSKGLQNSLDPEEFKRIWGEEGIARLIEAGHLNEDNGPLPISEFISLNRWLTDPANHPSNFVDMQVDVEQGAFVFNNTLYEIDIELAAVLKCLHEANGEFRTQRQIKSRFEHVKFFGRLDKKITAILLPHASGVGRIIESSSAGYRLKPH